MNDFLFDFEELKKINKNNRELKIMGIITNNQLLFIKHSIINKKTTESNLLNYIDKLIYPTYNNYDFCVNQSDVLLSFDETGFVITLPNESLSFNQANTISYLLNKIDDKFLVRLISDISTYETTNIDDILEIIYNKVNYNKRYYIPENIIGIKLDELNNKILKKIY